jgi:hypothetical protein
MNNKRLISSAFIILFIFYSIPGCVYIKPVDEGICTKLAPFVEDGKTKKEEVIQKSDFYLSYTEHKSKNNTICIFRFISSPDKNIYDLVLVFDENDVLKKHSLVKIW